MPWTRCSTASVGRHHLQEGAGRRRGHLLLDERGGPRAPGTGAQYLGSVVPTSDNYFACLNSAVFSDGSFVYIPPGVRCPMELSTYFRINAKDSGQFERTLIIADKGAYCSYLEGCTARCATRTSCTPPWSSSFCWTTPRSNIPPSRTGTRAIRRPARAASTTSSPSAPTAAAIAPRCRWTQVETGSAITWKYPSCVLRGEGPRASSTRSP
jgi:Fe-S cluster assembly protein SufB